MVSGRRESRSGNPYVDFAESGPIGPGLAYVVPMGILRGQVLTAAALLALTTTPGVAGAVGAAERPTCDGRKATIVVKHGDTTVEGTKKADVIVVKPGLRDVTVRAKGGRDRICGGAHKDTLKGGPGRDRIFARKGQDVLMGGTGADLLDSGLAPRHGEGGWVLEQYIRPGRGRDVVRGFGGAGTNDVVDYSHSRHRLRIDLADASVGADVVSGVRTVVGTRFDDVIRGAASDDILIGMGGDDTLVGRGHGDIIHGYTSTSVDHDRLLARPGPDGDDRLVGGTGNDDLSPGPGHNVARGGQGGDRLTVDKARGDRLDGGGEGPGSEPDRLTMYSKRVLRLDLRRDQTAPLSSIERLENFELSAPSGVVHGTDAAEYIAAEARKGGRFEVYGHGGDDDLDGSGEHRSPGTFLYGGDGDDEIRHGPAGHGGPGDDRVIAVEDAYGGDGDDRLGGSEIGVGGTGSDEVYVGFGNGPGAGDPTPRFAGGEGDDTFEHLGGSDWQRATLDGGPGRDGLTFDRPSLRSVEIDLAAGSERLTQGYPDNMWKPLIATLSGIEDVAGTSGDDELLGDDADNTLVGRDGSDTIDGRGGTDNCEGEAVSNCENP